MRGSRFWWGVGIGAVLAWWFTRPGKGGGNGVGGPGRRVRGRMSWSGLGRFR
jgi:hypothetical protein